MDIEKNKTDIVSNGQANREKLKEISKEAKRIQQIPEFSQMTINQILLNIIYQPKKGDKLVFDTFNGWRAKGMRVKKGEKAYLIWGRKRQNLSDEKYENQEAGYTDEEFRDVFEFFPLAYVFSNKQIEVYATPESEITGFEDLEENEDNNKRFTEQSEIF